MPTQGPKRYAPITTVGRDGQEPGVKARAPRASTGLTGDDDTATLDLGQVYDRHAAFVWRAARRLGVPEAALEDVVHDVFVIVHRRLGDYDGRAALTTWLYGITRGVASNARRGRVREHRRIERAQPKPATLPPTDDRTQRTEAAAFVRSFLRSLDPGKREVFSLVELEGYAVKDVAAMMRINVNTAHARLRAARRAFAEAAAVFRGDAPRRERA